MICQQIFFYTYAYAFHFFLNSMFCFNNICNREFTWKIRNKYLIEITMLTQMNEFTDSFSYKFMLSFCIMSFA